MPLTPEGLLGLTCAIQALKLRPFTLLLSSVTCVLLLSYRKTSSPDVMTSRDRKSTDSLGSLITFAVAIDTCFYLNMPSLCFQPLFFIVTFTDKVKGILFFLGALAPMTQKVCSLFTLQ